MAFKHYEPDPAGIRELGRSTALGDACATAARAGLVFAQGDDPDGQYEVRQAAVPVGWNNEYRSGALLEEVEPSSTGAERRTLVRSVPIIEAAS